MTMSQRIEDYALIGNTHTCALVGNNGSMDWLCLPTFASPSCFCALLGSEEHGYWQLAPSVHVRQVSRRYRDGTLILETDFETDTGAVTLIDFMPMPREDGQVEVIRMLRGRTGTVPMEVRLSLRFDYGRTVPWVRRTPYGLTAVAGPHAVKLATPIELQGRDFVTHAPFVIHAGQTVPFVLTWHRSFSAVPTTLDAETSLKETEHSWQEWSRRCTYQGEWRDAVLRSVITLKALTFSPTGGIIAAPTTSLPEDLGGERNWDYRYCWIRDATFTLYAMLTCGYRSEAIAWRQWLQRSVAGLPSQMQIMYGIYGEKLLSESEAFWLPGYENSHPVRIGNAAHEQFQLDVYGELVDVFHTARLHEIGADEDSWRIQQVLLEFLEEAWRNPDEGIWEVRGPRRHFTHSKVMAWVAADRAVKAVERWQLPGPVDKWRALRDTIHADILANGYDASRQSFVQFYGSDELDASLLVLPLVGFLPPEDPRIQGTLAAIERELLVDGLVLRYRNDQGIDGLQGQEGVFLICSFWLVDNLALAGRLDEARRLFERLLDLRNDVGLLAEEYDPHSDRQVGNFPQALSHVALINSAQNLSRFCEGPARERAQEGQTDPVPRGPSTKPEAS
jgi:GH15 family glucan-1,4-alpha-glucosidase